MSISNFKLGNRAQYEGSHPGFRGKKGVIISIDEMNDEETYLLKVDDGYQQYGDEVRVYPPDIRPIAVTDPFLVQNGFTYNETTKVFHGYPTDIIRLKVIRGTKNWRGADSLMLDDMGYLAINALVTDWTNEQEVKAKTTSVHYLHELQNYLEETHNVKLAA